MAGPALLTPEEEERLRQYQATLAAPQPQPQPAPIGNALEAVAPAPQPAPAPVGPALQAVAPSAPANPPPAAYILPSILASGGHISQEVFDSLTPVEQQYLRDLRRAAPQGVAPGSDLAKQFESYAKGLRDSTPQTYSFPDGSTVNMIGGQQISRPADPKASPAEIQQDDQGRFIAIDRATGVARVVTDAESGTPVMAKPKLTSGAADMASMIQNEISSNAARYQMLSQFGDEDVVKWDSDGLTYTLVPWAMRMVDGKTVKAEKDRLFKDTEAKQQRLEAFINPTAKPASLPSPSATPSPTPVQFASPDEVRAAVRSGQLDRAAAIEILRTQFQYK